MIEFKELSLQDKPLIDEYLKQSDYQSCEYTFSNLFIWRKYYNTVFAFLFGCVVFRTKQGGVYTYSYPAGNGDKRKAIEAVIENEHNAVIGWLTDSTREELENMFPGKFGFTEQREYAEYIYNAADLIELKGKKYHAKRNHISKFTRNSDAHHQFLFFDDENTEYCKKLYREWLSQKEGSFADEETALMECLENYKELGLQGAMIKNKEGICAFTIGGRLNSNTFVVHVEKGLDACDGAYAVINNYFASRAAVGFEFINREDDLGIEGLRKSKMSYYPVYLLNKYVAQLK